MHRLEEALDTNQRLLQELQHRVKNHLGIIASLVRLRAGQVTSEDARQELRAVGERIETLRLVHEQLYAAGNADCLRLRPFIVQLVENLCHLHAAQAGAVRLDFAIEEVELAPDRAVPIGLILTEFVTNRTPRRTGSLAELPTSAEYGGRTAGGCLPAPAACLFGLRPAVAWCER